MTFYKTIITLFFTVFFAQLTQAQWKSQRFAGIGLKDGQPALQVPIMLAGGLHIDANGNIAYGENANFRLRQLNATSGVINTIAGNGARLSAFTGIPLNSNAGFITEIEEDASGRLFFISEAIYRLDVTNNQLIRYDVSQSLGDMNDFVIAPNGNMFIVDETNRTIVRYDTVSKVATVVAGTGSSGTSPDGLNALSTSFNLITHVALAANGDLYIADANGHTIRKVRASDNIVETVAGTGTGGYSGDGGQANAAQINRPQDMIFDASGDLLFCDSQNNCIRKIDISTGIITTIAGTPGTQGAVTEGAVATATTIGFCTELAFNAAGELHILDQTNGKILKINASNIITTVAGNGQRLYGGDGAKAVDGRLGLPEGIAVDSKGNVYIADVYNNRIRLVNNNDSLSTFAGTGDAGQSGDGGAFTAANTGSPHGLFLDETRNLLYFSSSQGHYVRKIDLSSGIISTVAGDGNQGFAGDGGVGTAAQLSVPLGMTVDASGNLYIADLENNRVRKVDFATGVITTVAGDGTTNNTGDGGQATVAGVFGPRDVLIDRNGKLLITCQTQIRSVNLTTGVITTIAGTNTAGYSGDGGPATSAQLSDIIYGITEDDAGNLYVADQFNYCVRKIDVNGNISTIAGMNKPGESDGSGDALQMQFSTISDLFYKDGTLYLADKYNNTVWSMVEFAPKKPTLDSLSFVRDASNGNSSVTVHWTDNSLNEKNFIIERSVGGNTNYQTLTTLNKNTTQFVDNAVAVNTTYFYRIKSQNLAGDSTGNELSTIFNYTPPNAPRLDSLIFSRDTLSNKMVTIHWSDLSTNETGFALERSVNNGNYAVIATLNADTTRYIDTISYDTAYSYRVKALDFNESSAYSNVLDSTFIYIPPKEPTNLAASVQDNSLSQKNENSSASASAVNISWGDNANDEDGYEIERSTSTDASTFSQVAVLPSNSTSYKDATVALGVQYYYRIRAFNTDGASPYSVIFSFVLVGTQDTQLEAQTVAYPNPTIDRIQVKMSNNYQGKVQATLTALQGGMVTVIQWNKQSYQLDESLDVSQLPTGNYLLKIATDKGFTVKKIVKK
ncbi:hypothetical protein BKI52_36050 [marine bacterium AO1-C]|nr:hypothetical protein BKI52_36050 [marine bacterium AO1-C]